MLMRINLTSSISQCINVQKLYRKIDVCVLRIYVQINISTDCYSMINTRHINTVPLFEWKVSSFLVQGGHLVGKYGRGYQPMLRRNTAYCKSFDNYSGVGYRVFIYFLSDILSSYSHRNLGLFISAQIKMVLYSDKYCSFFARVVEMKCYLVAFSNESNDDL